MEEEDQKVFDENQAELKALGLKEDKAEEVVEPKAEDTKAEEVKPEEKSEEDEEPEDLEDKTFERQPKQVPIKEYKELKKQLQADFDEKLTKMREEMSKAKPSEIKSEDLEADITALAAELDFDKDKVRKIVETARKGLVMSPEDRELLAEMKTIKSEMESRKQTDQVKEQETIFNEEWNLTGIDKLYPNASPEQIAKAKVEMDVLAHSEKYHKLDLQEILTVQKANFDKILFSPKQKTFESNHAVLDKDDDAEFQKFDPRMTPAQVEQWEKSQRKYLKQDIEEVKVMGAE